MTTARDEILEAVRRAAPKPRVDRPDDLPVPAAPRPPFELPDAGPDPAKPIEDLQARFTERLAGAGGCAVEAGAGGPAGRLAELFPAATDICSAAAEVPGTRRVADVADPRDLADVDVGVLRARFGVAENGAVWLTEDDLGHVALGFLPQQLVVLLDPAALVADMHAAYRRIDLAACAYGLFMAGPSATADIEGVLIRGAQGVRSLTVLFAPE